MVADKRERRPGSEPEPPSKISRRQATDHFDRSALHRSRQQYRGTFRQWLRRHWRAVTRFVAVLEYVSDDCRLPRVLSPDPLVERIAEEHIGYEPALDPAHAAWATCAAKYAGERP